MKPYDHDADDSVPPPVHAWEAQPGPWARTLLHDDGTFALALHHWCREDQSRAELARRLRALAEWLQP